MIQRIQSVYLLLTGLLMSVSVFAPLLGFDISGKLTVHSYGIVAAGDVHPTWGVLTFAVLVAILAFVNIFLYKNRKQQIRICQAIIVGIVLYYVTLATYLYCFASQMGGGYLLSLKAGIIMPVVALILSALAMTKIQKDEKLVRSADRIR